MGEKENGPIRGKVPAQDLRHRFGGLQPAFVKNGKPNHELFGEIESGGGCVPGDDVLRVGRPVQINRLLLEGVL
jgi:hypothetical protein